MSCKKCKMLVCLIALAAMMAWTGVASADIVASFAGPKDFNGTSDYQALSDVSIGQEGSVQLEFKADTLPSSAGGTGVLWCLSDTPGGTLGEYKIGTYYNAPDSSTYLVQWSWTPEGYASVGSFQFSDTTNYHTVSLQWGNGVATKFTLDGVVASEQASSPAARHAFTSNNTHWIGCSPSGAQYSFDGSIRNVYVCNTYDVTVPEPSTLILVGSGLFGLLAYAWRKQK
jgi:hypothetical protein